jgi:anti-anti-sigma factor
MAIRIEHVGDVAVVSVEDVLTDGTKVDELKAVLLRIIESGGRSRVLVDLTRVQHLTSTAMGMLVRAYMQAIECGVALRICGLSPDVLPPVTWPPMLNVYESRDEALKALQEV